MIHRATSEAGKHPTTRFGLLVLLFSIAALHISCRSVPADTPTPDPTLTVTPLLARLHISAGPAGSLVMVDGQLRGHTPLSLVLAPGTYHLQVQAEGYRTWEQDVRVAQGDSLSVTATMADNAPPVVDLLPLSAQLGQGEVLAIDARAEDNDGLRSLTLYIDGRRVAESTTEHLEAVWDTSQEAPGLHQVLVEAVDRQGNRSSATQAVEVLPLPTVAPTPTTIPTATRQPRVYSYTTTLVVPSYPYERFLRADWDPRFGLDYLWLDRAAYEATAPVPEPRVVQAVVLENEYLRLTFVPELGGRLYQCVVKETGHLVFYQNAVLKPSYWGPLARDRNWWLAAGGMEWALPVNEHGYESGAPWAYRVQQGSDYVAILLQDVSDEELSGANRVWAEIRVTLPAQRTYFIVEPRVMNSMAGPASVQFWVNAALTLGSATTSPDTEFIFPTTEMVVHSTGDGDLPEERQSMSWPEYAGRDLSRYRNWRNWLGVFVPEGGEGFAAAYNHGTGQGIARFFPVGSIPGSKLFAFGESFAARAEFADDGTDYFEIWGGPCRTFWPQDDLLLGPGASLGWREVWWPFFGTEGIDLASEEVIAKLDAAGDTIRVLLTSSTDRSAVLALSWNGEVVHATELSLEAAAVYEHRWTPPANMTGPGILRLKLTDAEGAVFGACSQQMEF